MRALRDSVEKLEGENRELKERLLKLEARAPKPETPATLPATSEKKHV